MSRERQDLNRRDFVHRVGTLVALGGVTPSLLAQGCASPETREGAGTSATTATAGTAKLEIIGLQLYTVRTEMQKDVAATLERVSRIGFREVEFAGYFDRAPAEIRALLDANRLTAPAAHVDLKTMLTDTARVIDQAKTIGHRLLIVPWLAPEVRKSLDDYKRHAASFNTIGESLRKAGLRFAYHNHDFEFAALPGGIGYDVLLAETDPTLVSFELDLFWITKSKHDPLAYFAKYPGRFPSVHVKDMAPGGEQVEVGAGEIPWGTILRQRAKAGIEHYFVEQDEPKFPFENVEKSYRYLRALELEK